ncbi:M23 family metallopeptidase [Verrucomicrobiaceae bacterium N1E253]|uniref:M23 family metallopeptidase n=1 Tax=Oceaniferula marina TaxID=2748318 RepID=A0A851GAV9_9BACT|nr:M23 family metallopeptidase [Oceaniferula marina]NWK54898.1 M23 family metallopeptidase [Oceaniferula marina]
MKQRLIHFGVAFLFVAIAVLIAREFLKPAVDTERPIKSLTSHQDADAPLGFPVNDQPAPFDSRFIQLSGFERTLIPKVSRMSQPMGTEHGALTYNAQPFWADNPARGGHHTGDDLNGIGGMNTDLGDPVYAIANGLVIYRGEPSLAWGNTLIIAHRTPEGEVIQSMYAHLDQLHLAYGDVVYQGQTIGTVGTANLNYPAHLHFEIRKSSSSHIGYGYGPSPGTRQNPNETLAKYRGLIEDAFYAAPLQTTLDEQLNQQRIKNLIPTQ